MNKLPVDMADLSSSTSPRSITDLPIEILSLIASYLHPHPPPSSIHPLPTSTSLDPDDDDDDASPSSPIPSTSTSSNITHDILSLAYTCRKLYTSTLPSLYLSPHLTSTRQVRLLAQSLTQAYQSPKSHADELQEYNAKSRQIRHLFLPNDGMLMDRDQLMDQAAWAPSLRVIFNEAPMLESAFVAARTDGAILSELLDEGVECRLKRLTILNFYASPPFSMYILRPLSRLTHLNLINLIPRNALISLLTGSSPHSDPTQTSPPLTHLRLSQLHHETLHDFGAYISWRRSSEKWDRLSTSERTRDPPPRPSVPARRFEAQETLYALATASDKMRNFKRLTLELNALPPLPEPEHVPLLGQPSPQPPAAFGQIGDDVGFDNGSAASPLLVIEEAERTRTAVRDAYWIDVRDGKEALAGLFHTTRSGGSNNTNSDAHFTPIDIHIVAPRPGGWNRSECQKEFEATVAACQMPPEEDSTCHEDPDVFCLGERRPWLTYQGTAKDKWKQDTKADVDQWQAHVKDQCWWDGLLPRFDAAAATTTRE